MKRFWLALGFITGISLAAVWIASHPGDVVIHWFGYRIETSFALMLFAAVTAAWLLFYLYTSVLDLLTLPKRMAEKNELNHYKKGVAELTYSVAALASANMLEAEKHAQKAERWLGQTPMGLLISAQIAKSRGHEDEARAMLQQMLDYKETRHMAEQLLTDQSESSSSKKSAWRKLTSHFTVKR